MTKPLTELFEEKIQVRAPLDEQSHSDFTHGLRCESDRRKPIDLATKKLIEALQYVRLVCKDREQASDIIILKCLSESSTALAEFRKVMEEVE